MALDCEDSTNELEQNLQSKNKKLIIGISVALVSAFCYVSGLVAFQRIYDAPPDFQLNTLRFILGLTIITSGLITKRTVPKISVNDTKWLALAGIGFISVNLLMYTNEIRFLPLGTVGSMFTGNATVYSHITAHIGLMDEM